MQTQLANLLDVQVTVLRVQEMGKQRPDSNSYVVAVLMQELATYKNQSVVSAKTKEQQQQAKKEIK